MKRDGREGFVLVAVLSMAFLIVILLTVTSSFAVSSRQAVASEAQKIPAFYVANAGIERSIKLINKTIDQNKTTYAVMNSSDGIAADIYPRVFTSSSTVNDGAVGVGNYKVTATLSGNKINITSKGKSGSSEKSIVTTVYIEKSSFGISADAALETTTTADKGTYNTGNAPITGVKGAPDPSKAFGFECTLQDGRCARTKDVNGNVVFPIQYSISVAASAVAPAVGTILTYNVSSSDPKSSVRYKVSDVKVQPDNSNIVTLSAITEDAIDRSTGITTPIVLGSPYSLTTTTSVASAVAYNAAPTANSTPTAGTCGVYDCLSTQTTPGSLFKSVFGISMSDFKNDLASNLKTSTDSIYNAKISKGKGGATMDDLSSCDVVHYATISNATTVNLNYCTNARVLVIDNGDSVGSLQINTSNAPFVGVIFVKSGGAVNFAGNGVFKGSIFVDNGGSSASSVTINGTAGTSVPSPCPAIVDGISNPKVCYDSATVQALSSQIRSTLDDSSKPKSNDRFGWKEIK